VGPFLDKLENGLQCYPKVKPFFSQTNKQKTIKYDGCGQTFELFGFALSLLFQVQSRLGDFDLLKASSKKKITASFSKGRGLKRFFVEKI